MHKTITSALKISLLAAFLSAASGLTVPGAYAGNLYNQASTFPSDQAWASQNDTSVGGFGNYATTYDNFTLTGSSNITDVNWDGQYWNPTTQGPISAFTINFYTDNSGQPGSEVFTDTIAGTANETFIGNNNLGGGISDPDYSYSTPLDTTFVATGGVTYWMSIVASLAYPPEWGWDFGSGGDGISYQFFEGPTTQHTNDQAFGLSGTSAVPEPSSVAILLIGSLTLSFMVIRKRRESLS